MTSEHRKTHIPILSWGMPVEVRSSSMWGSNVMAASVIASPLPLGPRQHQFADADRDQDRSQDQGRGEQDAENFALEFQVHEVEGHEDGLDDRRHHEAAGQRELRVMREQRPADL